MERIGNKGGDGNILRKSVVKFTWGMRKSIDQDISHCQTKGYYVEVVGLENLIVVWGFIGDLSDYLIIMCVTIAHKDSTTPSQPAGNLREDVKIF